MSKNYDSKKVDQDEVFYYIEDITRWCEDINFIFEWLKQYFTNERI